MAGLAKVVLSKCRSDKRIWRLLGCSPHCNTTFIDGFHSIRETACQILRRNCSVPKDGAERRIAGLSPGNAAPSFCSVGLAQRGYASAVATERSGISSSTGRSLAFAGLVVGSGVATYYFYPWPKQHLTEESPSSDVEEEEEEEQILTNWSNTHEVKTKVYFQPESLEELEKVVQNAHKQKQKIRAVGSGLSPNGMGFCSDGMVNLALMDAIVDVDVGKGRVTVQAGASVDQLVAGLRPYDLTLPNYASISQQQIGGLTQVGAHGTGGRLATLDEYILGLTLVTPEKGTLYLSPESDPELFYFARCGLGGLGVVAELTLQCVPRHRLLEHTSVTDIKALRENHKDLLNNNRHLKYMWIPDTDTVVVVQWNPLPEGKEAPKFEEVGEEEKLRSVRELYKETAAKRGSQDVPKIADEQKENELKILSDTELSELSFTEMRDILIAADPLNREHVLRVNKAEADYWKLSEGYRVGWSDELLGFDCGGQQWVSEISLPAGTLKTPSMAEVEFIERLLEIIREKNIPAPAPIEQRWSASSRSPMSLASSTSADAVFSWVGIIMYLPTLEDKQRTAITEAFSDYRKAAQLQLWDEFNAHEHWAKMEPPEDEESLQWLRNRLRKRFPVEKFNLYRAELDPHHILTNHHLDQIFPL